MEWNLSSNICRCCLSQGSFKGLNSPNFWMGEEELYSVMLRECFDVTLSQSDKMSDSGICEVCITQLRNSFNFKKQVLNSEALFQARLTEHSTKVETDTEIKVEILEDHGSDKESNSDFGAERLDDLQDMEQVDMEIKYESPPEKKRGGSKRSSATLASSAPVKKSKRIKKETSAKTVASKRSSYVVEATTVTPLSQARLRVRRLVQAAPVPEKRKHKTNLATILQYSNVTPFRCKTLLGFACAYCTSAFPDPEDLRSHTRVNHEKVKLNYKAKFYLNDYAAKLDIASLLCNICEIGIDDLTALVEHLIDVHKKKYYTDVGNRIIPYILSKGDTHNCVLCSATFSSFKMLQQHMNVHFSNFSCQICGAGYVNSHFLKNHEIIHKTGSFQCEHCTKVFDTPTKRKLHERSVHLGMGERNKCPHCPEKFISYYSRNQHLVQVHNRPRPVFKCNACDRVFHNKFSLTAHTKKDHLLERNHKCHVCELRFYFKTALDKHMVKHSGLKSFKCEVCLKCYARKQTLREHMRIHNNDRRFKCVVCSQTFVQNCSMKSHMQANHPTWNGGLDVQEHRQYQSRAS